MNSQIAPEDAPVVNGHTTPKAHEATTSPNVSVATGAAPPSINLEGFRWGSADEKVQQMVLEETHGMSEVDKVEAKPTVATPSNPPLGPLSSFKGTFAGSGFNTIFRPNNGTNKRTTFKNPVTPKPPTAPSENVLELNLTHETLSFSSPLGTVPNRGLTDQPDILLNGVPYVQSINDVTNMKTGKGDGKPIGIHFEPGLWMHVPATTNDPVLAASLVRMASIPHGTTINAQSIVPNGSIAGGPQIPVANITPFPIGGSQATQSIPFKAQTASLTDTPRIPQDLTKFVEAGTITQAILDDPNTVLRDAIKGQKITKTVVFTVSTAPQQGEIGGGTTNISFLEGTAATASAQPNANAQAIQMSATFWIETVEHQITVPAFNGQQQKEPVRVSPAPHRPGAPVPTFLVIPPPHHVTEEKTVTVSSTQIQYSQTVLLNFAGLSWPHTSVATLVPTADQPVLLSGEH